MNIHFTNPADEYLHQEIAQVVRLFYPADADITIQITHSIAENNAICSAKSQAHIGN